jgi:hypothetical protein
LADETELTLALGTYVGGLPATVGGQKSGYVQAQL